MKLFALTCGRKNANCEILVKEALAGAEEKGAQVEMARMLDLDIKHCKICWPCPSMLKGPEACIRKDDGAFLLDKIMDSDAFLLAAPVYTLTPPGYLIAIRDRILGPRVDISSLTMIKKAGLDPKFESFGKMFVDERVFKKRVGGLISVGGAATAHWVSLGLPLLHTLMFSALMRFVDQMNVLKVAEDGAVTLREDLLARARQLGRNLVEAYNSPSEETPYLGDEEGICPVCRTNLMMMDRNSNFVECSVCGIRGEVKITDGRIDVSFSKEEQGNSRYKFRGLELHNIEVFDVSKELEPRMPEVRAGMEKYKAYDKWVVKPSGKSAKGSRQ
jgi:multimeric flavodoxin WrbA